MSEKFFVAVAVAAIAPGAAHAGKVADLVTVATGSPRDYTKDERAQAVSDLATLAEKGDADAGRALVALLGSDLHHVVVTSLDRVRTPATTAALVALLDRVDVGDEKNTARAQELCSVVAGTRDPSVVRSLVRVVDDGATKELRVACLRSFGRFGAGPFAKSSEPDDAGNVAATKALVGYVDHRVLGATAREVLLHMRAAVEPLRPLLSHGDPEVRAFATRLLGGSETPEVASALAKQLKEAVDDKGRVRALRGLAVEFCGDAPYGKPDEPCDPAKGKQLAALVIPFFKSEGAADAAVDAVRRVRDRSLVQPLIGALDHSSSSVREKSAELLGKIGDPAAKKALTKKLDTTTLTNNWSELDGYMKGLTGCGITDDDAAFFAAFLGRKDIASTSFSWNHPQMWQQLARLQPASSKAFIPLLRNPSRDAKKSIAKLLGQLGDPGSAVALLDVVEANDDIKDDAAAALGACADETALPRMQRILEKKLQKEPWSGGGELALAFVRADRASGLERTLSLIGKQGPLGVELLRALLKETHPSDARAFVKAFAQKNEDASTTYTYQWLAILGWARIDTPTSIDTLCTIATTNADAGVRKLAAVNLKSFPEPRAIGCMVTALKNAGSDGDEIVRALQEATGEELESVKDWDVYVGAGFGIGGGEEALKKALTSENSSARSLAATQLGKQKKALPELLAALPSESSSEARLSILGAIAAHDDASAKKPLVDELERKRSSWPERVVIAKALDRLGEGRGTLELLKLVDGADGDAAQKAMLALSEVTGEPPTSSPPFWRAWWKAHAERYRMPDR